MTSWSLGVLLAITGIAAVVLIVDLVRDRAAQDSHFIALAVVELGALIQLVAGFIALARNEREVEGVVFGSYLVTIALIPIAGGFLGLAERTRVGTTIMLLAVATVAGLDLRLWDLWSAHA